LHCPLAAGTHHLINRQTLREMKPSAILINTGRGPLVDEQDVADALNESRLRAYCVDVLSEEPPLAGRSTSGRLQSKNPLLRCENAFITPHIAWATKEARMRLIEVAVNNVKAFVNERPENVIC
ncbi:MAG: D-2-hydroxyacid dehydrogenase, partial [Prevotella sp.]|nr:D-2-hydroxyacid dehydrogenase [Prevotella sp.]